MTKTGYKQTRYAVDHKTKSQLVRGTQSNQGSCLHPKAQIAVQEWKTLEEPADLYSDGQKRPRQRHLKYKHPRYRTDALEPKKRKAM
jgi:hypothetical protein